MLCEIRVSELQRKFPNKVIFFPILQVKKLKPGLAYPHWTDRTAVRVLTCSWDELLSCKGAGPAILANANGRGWGEGGRGEGNAFKCCRLLKLGR
jgi:hypothetical protein